MMITIMFMLYLEMEKCKKDKFGNLYYKLHIIN